MIIVKLQGGLGNQMFQYALGRHLALLHQTELKLDLSFLLDRTPRENFVYRDYDLDIFSLQVGFASAGEAWKPTPQLVNGRIDRVRQRIFRRRWHGQYVTEPRPADTDAILSLPDDVYLDGYWQNERYFAAIKGIIRNDFTLKPGFLDATANQLRATIEDANSVCLNIRRTDFVDNPLNSAMLGWVGLEYIQRAAQAMTERVAEPCFMVFSDDIEWCIEHIRLAYPTQFITHEYAGPKFAVYLELMRSCKHFIIPNSTFAWWAAWLAPSTEKIIIAPKRWYAADARKRDTPVPSRWVSI